jgi:hypothetical protein
MNLILTQEQQETLHKATDHSPVIVVDPATEISYVLVRADVYEQCRALFTNEPFDVREAYPAMDAVAGSEGWLDPEIDAYVP